jgi:glycosyltransferase involved in cell wall biosynthesis
MTRAAGPASPTTRPADDAAATQRQPEFSLPTPGDPVDPPPPEETRARRPRIAFLSYSSGFYDWRTQRMARTAIDAGYAVVVYARWYPGAPLVSEEDGYRVIRVPAVAKLAVPGMRGSGLRRLAAIQGAEWPRADRPTAARAAGGSPAVHAARANPASSASRTRVRSGGPVRTAARLGRRLVARVPKLRALRRSGRGLVTWLRIRVRRVANRLAEFDPLQRWQRRLTMFPVRPMGWREALLLTIDEPADIWHGMWAGSLPSLEALRHKFGGRTIYDSRDIYMRSRGFDDMGPGWRPALAAIERHWARRCDAVLTVNDQYATILASELRIDRPAVVRNTPPQYEIPDPRPNRFRALLGLPPTTRIVLYQGGFITDRGIEQGMDAIIRVPDAVLVLMGFGNHRDALVAMASRPPYVGRVHVVDPVPPADLLEWTASADVMLMAIQPTTLNHRYTTPQKLWEAIAAGVPIVATDLPGMAEVVSDVGCGALVDGTDPVSIAAGIRRIIDGPAEERAAMSARAREAAATRYNWESQAGTLLDLYATLSGRPAATTERQLVARGR